MIVHDQCDALGELIDTNADGRLGEREIGNGGTRLSKLDVNHDEQISNAELPYTMIVAIVRGQPLSEQSLDRPVSRPISPDAGVTSWFLQADYNDDGDISRREFFGSSEQFNLLDKNKDGFISADEVRQDKTMQRESKQ